MMIVDRRMLLLALTGLLPHGSAWSDAMPPRPGVIDDLSQEAPMASVGTRWQLITDRVMGGVSEGTMVREVVFGRPAIRMRGDVSLDNNGGFVQMALDLSPTGGDIDANDWIGVELDVRNVSTTLRQWLLDFKLDFLRLALVG